ncbi:MAG: AzlD domain-containing protein [Desulfobacterales bacterium]|nr:AzlD domain-containing protein [Desulfobacterales bacterium]
MTPNLAIFLVISIAAILTYGLRIGGLLLSEKLPQQGLFQRFMEALPGTILLSLIAPGVVGIGLWGWIATASTAFCAYKTGNILLSMLVGMAVMIAHRNFIPF